MAFEISNKGSWINETLEGHCFDAPLCDAVATYLKQQNWKSVIDLGCGPGWYVKGLRDKGFQVSGYDGNPYTSTISAAILQDNTSCQQLDLTEKIKFEQSPDCILSLEVGEHIPDVYENIFINNITDNAVSGIILSWAIEGQPGSGHVNCRNNDYIIERLLEKGFREDIAAKNRLRIKSSLQWFADTIMVFRRMDTTVPRR